VKPVSTGCAPLTKGREEMEIEVTDRYKATGTPYPAPATMCKGQCEGMGLVPIYMNKDVKQKRNQCIGLDETDPRFIALWKEAHRLYRLKLLYASYLFWKEKPWKISRLIAAFKPFDGYHFVVCPDCGGSRKAAQGGQG